jgi:hypothetical protein
LKLCKDGRIKRGEALEIFYELVQSGLRIEEAEDGIISKTL